MDNQAFHERFKRMLMMLGTNGMTLSKQLGRKRPDNIYKLLSGEIKPNLETIEQILNIYPQINAHWFIKGEGEPFLKDELNKKKGLPFIESASFKEKEMQETRVTEEKTSYKEIEQLEIENRHLKMENELLKKSIQDKERIIQLMEGKK